VSNAQSKVEAHHFDVRKHLLEYDDVMNKQREVIYHRRRGILSGEGLREEVLEIAEGLAEDLIATVASAELAPPEWDWKEIDDAIARQFAIRLALSEEDRASATAAALTDRVIEGFRHLYEEKERAFTPQVMRQIEKIVMLQTLDTLWKDHLLSMDHLKEGIGLRGYGQKNPLQEYQKEGFALFEEMLARFESEIVERLATVQVQQQPAAPGRPAQHPPAFPSGVAADAPAQPAGSDQPSAETLAMMQRLEARQRAEQQRRQQQTAMGAQALKSETVKREGEKVGRNDPCPCGSGKKYKKCHGA
jgi:preprotein translocase subunit SecA